MTEEFVQKMASYLAFLFRERDRWREVSESDAKVRYFGAKIEAVMDICSMFNCRSKVLQRLEKYYKPMEGFESPCVILN